MFNFEDRIDLIFKTGFFNFQFNFSRALALAEELRLARRVREAVGARDPHGREPRPVHLLRALGEDQRISA